MRGDCQREGRKYMRGRGGEDFDCSLPDMCRKTSRECVKTYKACYKLYRFCTYRLFKICSRCGLEFDYYARRGVCPRCR